MNHTKKATYFFFLTVILITTLACQDNTAKANLILTNTNIWTGNINQPNAQALAIAGETILAIDTNEEIQAFKGAKTEIKANKAIKKEQRHPRHYSQYQKISIVSLHFQKKKTKIRRNKW